MSRIVRLLASACIAALLFAAAPAVAFAASASDSSFDPRDEGLVTPVQNQYAFDLCGVFSSLASLETSLVYQGVASDELMQNGLSPYQASYFIHVGEEEVEAYGNPYMPVEPYAGGTTPAMVASSLAAGKGAVIMRQGVNDWGNPQFVEDLRFASDVRLAETLCFDADVVRIGSRLTAKSCALRSNPPSSKRAR